MLNSIFEFFLLSSPSSLPSIHGGHDGDSGLLGLVDKFLDTLILGLEGGWNLFPGINYMGWNLHPLLVHFPIALLVSFVLIDTLGTLFKRPGWRRFATQLLGLGALFSIPTVVAGFYAAYTVPHGALAHAIMEHHEHAGILIVTISTFLALWRNIWGLPKDAMAKTFSGILTVLLAAALLLGADLGADMVYVHGVAVKTSSSDLPQSPHHHSETASQQPLH